MTYDFLTNLQEYIKIFETGCSSARLEYTSGGRVVAGSNPVIPTNTSQLERVGFLVLREHVKLSFKVIEKKQKRETHRVNCLSNPQGEFWIMK